jgi:hypothetical protein
MLAPTIAGVFLVVGYDDFARVLDGKMIAPSLRGIT